MKKALDQLVAEWITSGELEAKKHSSPVRPRIVRAALSLFAARSYEATTTKAIAQRARTTERTLFKHFHTKEELFAKTVFPAFLRALLPDFEQPAVSGLEAEDDTFRATLHALLQDRIQFYVRNPTLFIMVCRELLVQPAFRAAYRKVVLRLGRPRVDAVVALGKRSGELRDVPTDTIVRAIAGQVVVYLFTRLVLAPKQTWDTEADVNQMVDVILHGIGAPDGDDPN